MSKVLSIVINQNCIRVAELSKGKRGVSVLRLLDREIPGELVDGNMILDVPGLAAFLADLLHTGNIKTRAVVFSMPSDRIMTREIILPNMKEDKLRAALNLNASEYFPIDLSDYVLGYFPISQITEEEPQEKEPEAEAAFVEEPEEKGAEKGKKARKAAKTRKKQGKPQKLRLMVLAAPDAMVQAYYDMARLARLRLQALDFVGNSVFQLTSTQVGEETCLVILLDADYMVLSFYNEGVMVLQRHVDFGISTMVHQVMEHFQMSYDEAFKLLEHKNLVRDVFEDGDEITGTLEYPLRNVRHTIEYYRGRFERYPIERVYLMGEGNSILGIEQLFSRQLSLPAEKITALKQVYIKEGTGVSTKEALAYMDNIGAVLAPVGFLPKKLEQDIRHKVEKKSRKVMILLALFISVVVVTIPAMDYLSVSMDNMDLENQLRRMEDTQTILDDYELAQQRHTDMQEVLSRTGTDNEGLLEFIHVFEQLRPSNMSITAFSCDEGQITFSALASGKETVAKLIQQLNTISGVSSVKVSSLNSSFDGEQETVSFSLVCKLSRASQVLFGETGQTEDGTGQEGAAEAKTMTGPDGEADGGTDGMADTGSENGMLDEAETGAEEAE